MSSSREQLLTLLEKIPVIDTHEHGYYTLDYAKRVGRYILHDNAERLYGFR